MNEVGKFMEALENDPKAKELSENIIMPVDEEKAIDLYFDLAKKLGFTFSREDLINWAQEKEKEYQVKSEKVEDDMLDSLDLNQMDLVAGGGKDERCWDTFRRGEWCWFVDSCKSIIKQYRKT